jgi:predicted RNase H-like nuclease/Holliday junction resolvase RusA-like endonuclease
MGDPRRDDEACAGVCAACELSRRWGLLYIGVDLAWGLGGMTGLAAVDDKGDLVDVARMRTDAEILNWLAPKTAGPCLVAIDAPIVVRNATGNRACEKLVGRYFGGYGASCHSANTANPAFSGGTRALRLANNLGLDIDPGSAAERCAIEVYPHPAIVALFGLPSIVQYKNKQGRSLGLLQAETQRLLGLIEELGSDPVPLHARTCPGWSDIRHAVDTATTKAALGRVEDSIDGVVCAYVARLAHLSPTRVRTLGTVSDGYILTPVTPQIAARIDADQNRDRPTAAPRRASVETPAGRPSGPPFLILDVIGRPASYSSAATKPWQDAIRAEITKAEATPRKTRFGVRITFRTPVPASTNEVWDLDNLIKPALDAMEGVFGRRPWQGLRQAADDQVDFLEANKHTARQGEHPGAHIEIFDLGDSPYRL